jgi:hypothetical protein
MMTHLTFDCGAGTLTVDNVTIRRLVPQERKP